MNNLGLSLVPAIAAGVFLASLACGGTAASVDAGSDAPSSARNGAVVDVLAPVFSDTATLQLYFVASANPGSSSGPVCTFTVSGACQVTRCPTAGPAAGGTTTYASAGTVTVSVGSPPFSITATPSADGSYAPATAKWPPGAPFPGAEDVTVTAQGGTVPAFRLPSAAVPSLKFPRVLGLSQPTPSAPPLGNSVVIPVRQDQDLALSWTRGAADVRLYVEGVASAPNETTSLTCEIDSTAGQATIPKDLLAPLPSGTQVRLSTVGSYAVTAGTWDVTFRILTDVTTLDEKAAISLVVQ